jgi:hypothetical protein
MKKAGEDGNVMKIRVRVKVPFGEITIDADTPKEILETLRNVSPNLISEMRKMISIRLARTAKARLKGIVKLTAEGPIITTGKRLTHYEAIGLILYASIEKMLTAAQLQRLLKPSGIKPMVPARLNEMHKRGLVFKPDPSKPGWKLSANGRKWIEENALVRLKEKKVTF